jgi:transcription elongation factor Elf1
VKVQSALLPFQCPQCGAEVIAPVAFEHGAEVAQAPAGLCGVRMELDGIPDQHLP